MSFQRIALFVIAVFISVSAAAQTASFTGVVRNSNGAPLGDMTVQAYNPAGFPVTATTDSQGRYLLVVPAGTYRLVAYDNSGTYAVSFYGGVGSFDQSAAINVIDGQVVANVDFVLPPGVKISGIVVDATFGGGLQGAIVAAYNLDGTRRTFVSTNQDGSYTLTVPPGSYKVVAYHDVTPLIPVFFQNQRLFENATIVTPPATNVNFGLAIGTKILGTIREKHTGVGLGGIAIVAYDLNGNVQFRTESNPAGSFAFVLPPGSYKFAVEDPSGIYETTFYRDAKDFASAATIVADAAAPLLQFSIGKIPNGERTFTQYVPGVIHSQNTVSGTFFKTDVWLQNPGDTSLTVMATYLPSGQDNSAATGLPVVIPPHGQRYLQDIVRTLFGTSGAGALRLEAPAAFRATSRTYNVPPNAAEAGTFGLSIPAQSVGESRGRATLTGLAQNADSRSNIGIMNPQPFAVDILIEVFSANGSLLGSRTVTLQPGQWEQPPVAGFVPVQFEHGYAVVSSATGSFFSYAAVVDAKSQDGTIIMPTSD